MPENELQSYLQQLALPGKDYPSASNRGVIDPYAPLVFSHLDFLQATFEAPHNHGGGVMTLPGLDSIFRMTTERHGIKNYRYGANLSPAGSFFWNEQNDVQPGYMVLTGDDLGLIRARAQVTDRELLKTMLKPARRVTRLDFAVNITAGNPDDVLQAWDTGKIKTRAQNCKRIDEHGKKRGYTIYLGSQKSDKYIRCYDKAAELKLLHTVLTRIEMQTGGDVAHRLAKAMSFNGVKTAGKQAMRDFADCQELTWWQQATSGDDCELQLTPAKETSFARWLNEQVYPAIEKRAQAGQETEAITHFTRALMALHGDLGAKQENEPNSQ